MLSILIVLVSALSWSLPVAAQEQDCVCLEVLPGVTDLRSPTTFVFSPDGTGRKFVAEQMGLVWILDANNNRLPNPFMDLSEIVVASGELGFLAIAFHPDYVNNRRLFIYYSLSINSEDYTRLSEILVSESDPNVVDYASERPLLEVLQPFSNHNGGDIIFHDDGYLYLGIGDGGWGGDPLNQAQNISTLLGSIIRIDVDVGTEPYTYGIPPDNPFVGVPLAREEIFAYGVRNPWRIGMDLGDRDTGAGRGRVFFADVGQDAYEEVDLLEAGGNYAWRCKEGFEEFDMSECGTQIPDEVLPILAYDHATTGGSVTGGYVYRGIESPSLNGWYIFADYMEHKLFRMIEPSQGVYEWKEIFTCSTSCTANGFTNEFGVFVQSFGQGPDGEVYFVTNDEYAVSLPVGNGYRIVQDPSLP